MLTRSASRGVGLRNNCCATPPIFALPRAFSCTPPLLDHLQSFDAIAAAATPIGDLPRCKRVTLAHALNLAPPGGRSWLAQTLPRQPCGNRIAPNLTRHSLNARPASRLATAAVLHTLGLHGPGINRVASKTQARGDCTTPSHGEGVPVRGWRAGRLADRGAAAAALLPVCRGSSFVQRETGRRSSGRACERVRANERGGWVGWQAGGWMVARLRTDGATRRPLRSRRPEHIYESLRVMLGLFPDRSTQPHHLQDFQPLCCPSTPVAHDACAFPSSPVLRL